MRRLLALVAVVCLLSTPVAVAQCDCSSQGDCDGSGDVNVADVTYLVAYLFQGGTAPEDAPNCPSDNTGDVNCDTVVHVADLTYLVAYLFQGGPEPCDLCWSVWLEPGDSASVDYLQFLDTNLYNAIYDSGFSAYVYVNHPGVDYDLITVMVGDTTVEVTQGLHAFDSAEFWQFVPAPPKGAPDSDRSDRTPVTKGEAGADRSTYRVTIPPTYSWRNGSPVSSTPLVINGNRIQFRGVTTNLERFLPFSDPPVSNRIWSLYTSPAPSLTADQISLACGEGALAVMNARTFSLLETRWFHWTAGDHSYAKRVVIDLLVDRCYTYTCPDGPLEDTFLLWWTLNITWYRDGIKYDSYEQKACYYREF